MIPVDHCFRSDLRTPRGMQVGYLMPFASLEAVCCDIYASLPDVAAELLRDAIDPMACAYLVRDHRDNLLLEIEFSELLRSGASVALVDRRGDDDWMPLLADLRCRSEDAFQRMDRATAWMNRITARALAVGDRRT